MRVDRHPGEFRRSREYFRVFSAISGHFWPILGYFEGNIPPETARGMFIQAGASILQNMVSLGKSLYVTSVITISLLASGSY